MEFTAVLNSLSPYEFIIVKLVASSFATSLPLTYALSRPVFSETF